MPFSSGRARAVFCAAALLSASCASSPPHAGGRGTFVVEGEIVVEGTHPFDRVIIIEDAEGIEWPLEAGRMDYELSLLEGHRARVTCRRPGIHDHEGRIEVLEYVLAPVDGMKPVRGTVVFTAGAPALETGGERFLLAGPLSAVVGEWAGHEAWVWGSRGGSADGPGTVIEVSGFEVLGRR